MFTNPGPLVYGTITVGALLDAESTRGENFPDTVGAVALAMVTYWLAHSYARLTADRLEAGKPLTFRIVGETMAHELAIITGAAVPLLAVVISWLAGASLTTAVNVAIWLSAVMILLIEAAAAVRARLEGVSLVVQIGVGALLGVLIIAVKLVLH